MPGPASLLHLSHDIQYLPFNPAWLRCCLDSMAAEEALSCREKILSRTENLKEAHVEVQLFNLTPAETAFDMGFWRQVISNPEDDLGGQSADVAPIRLEVIFLFLCPALFLHISRDAGSTCMAMWLETILLSVFQLS